MLASSLFACLVVALADAPTEGPKIGDVIVTIEPAEVSVDDRVVGYVDVGNVLVVVARDGERLRVNYAVPGWISASKAATPVTAMEHFTLALQQTPERADLYLARGRARQAAGDSTEAISDLSAAVRLAPSDVRPRLMRGHAYEVTEEYDAALADFDRAILLAPSDSQSLRMRAGLHAKIGRYAAAVSDYNRAIRLSPEDAAVSNDRAWLSATCPDDRFRNGRQAVEDATHACEQSGWKTYNRLGTLAAALAEEGEFEAAVRRQTESLSLAPPAERKAALERLKLYSAGKPYREYPSVRGSRAARAKTDVRRAN